MEAGGVIYHINMRKSAANAIEYAVKYAEEENKYVWCDAISISFLRLLDPENGKQVLDKMAIVYKFYACLPSLNWVKDDKYCRRAWMWQEYICGELLVLERKDADTLDEILKAREESMSDSCTVLKRKKMTTELISHLLKSAVKHYQNCEVCREIDLPNACFGLLTTYGLFTQIPENKRALKDFKNTSVSKGDLCLHPLRLLMRGLIKLVLLHDKRGIECAVQFAKSSEGQEALETILTRDKSQESRGQDQVAPERSSFADKATAICVLADVEEDCSHSADLADHV